MNRLPGTGGVTGSGMLVTLSFTTAGRGATSVSAPAFSPTQLAGPADLQLVAAADGQRKVSRCDAGIRRGLTLVELIVAFSIMLILTTMAVPLARSRVRIERERELRWAVREIRTAIDKYKDYADAGYLGQQKLDSDNYPESWRPWWKA